MAEAENKQAATGGSFIADWTNPQSWKNWLATKDADLNAEKRPVVEFVFNTAKLEGKAQRVHVWLGLLVTLVVLGWALCGLEFVAHALSFAPLMRTLRFLRQNETAAQRDRQQYIFWVTYWSLVAFLIVFESFFIEDDDDEDDVDDDGNGNAEDDNDGDSSLELVWHLLHILFLAWCNSPKYKGALVVYNKVIVPLQTKLGGLFAGKPAAAAGTAAAAPASSAASPHAAASPAHAAAPATPTAGHDGKKAN